MTQIQSLTSLLCQSILDDPFEAEISHICLNLTLKTVSACYRTGIDGTVFTQSFTLSPDHFLGSLLQERDGQYWQAPELVTWHSVDEYKEKLGIKETPKALPWCALLRPFNSVELIREDPEMDMISMNIFSGQQIARAGCWNELLIDLP
jgi:hypothetical protein